jgi:hypothetical protein
MQSCINLDLDDTLLAHADGCVPVETFRMSKGSKAFATVAFLMNHYVSQGNLKQTRRLANWVVKQPNADSLLSSISFSVYASILESMETEATLYDTRQKIVKQTTLKLNVPVVACLLTWADVVVKASAKREAPFASVSLITSKVFARLASILSRIVPVPSMRIVSAFRKPLKHYMHVILRICANHAATTCLPFLYPVMAVWQLCLLLDSIGVHRARQQAKSVFSKPLIDCLSIDTLYLYLSSITSIVQKKSVDALYGTSLAGREQVLVSGPGISVVSGLPGATGGAS